MREQPKEKTTNINGNPKNKNQITTKDKPQTLMENPGTQQQQNQHDNTIKPKTIKIKNITLHNNKNNITDYLK